MAPGNSQVFPVSLPGLRYISLISWLSVYVFPFVYNFLISFYDCFEFMGLCRQRLGWLGTQCNVSIKYFFRYLFVTVIVWAYNAYGTQCVSNLACFFSWVNKW